MFKLQIYIIVSNQLIQLYEKFMEYVSICIVFNFINFSLKINILKYVNKVE